MIVKRIAAYIIDYLILSIPIMIVSMMIGTLPLFQTHGDFPFMILAFVYLPHVFWGNLIRYPGHYGNLMWLPCVILAALVLESIVYSIMIWRKKATVGMRTMKIEVAAREDQGSGIGSILLWNMVRVFSKYILAVPLLLSVVSKGKGTFYDRMCKLNVHEK